MNRKTIEIVAKPSEPHYVGDGFRVHNFIPSHPRLSLQRMSPFALLDYNAAFYFPPTDTPRGVAPHPHRGLETVTIAYQGVVEHHDSTGSGGVIAEGDVQWMTAGAGLLHKEYHEKHWSQQGGVLQMVQLWVNLPKAHKMTSPRYQALAKNEIPKVSLADDAGQLEVIAGDYKGQVGAAKTFSPLCLYNLHLRDGKTVSLDFPSHYNTALLVVKGDVCVNDSETVETDGFVLFANDGEQLTITATGDALVLVMSGEPIAEPIVAHGPFVMNTREQITKAYQDYHEGMFGQLS